MKMLKIQSKLNSFKFSINKLFLYSRSVPQSRYKNLQKRIQSQQEEIFKLETSNNIPDTDDCFLAKKNGMIDYPCFLSGERKKFFRRSETGKRTVPGAKTVNPGGSALPLDKIMRITVKINVLNERSE